MMLDLGKLSITNVPSFNEARRKILQLAKTLGFCPIEAPRMATLLSEAIRPGGGKSTSVSFYLTDHGPSLTLVIDLRCSGGEPHAAVQGQYFDTSFPTDTDQNITCRLSRRLPFGATMPNAEALSSMREMLALPSREELLLNLESKNKALKRSEARIQAALESAPDPLVMVSPDGNIVYANSMAVTVFGYAKDELLGQSISILLPDDIRATHPQRVQQFFRENKTRDFTLNPNLQVKCKDGSCLFVDIKLSPLQTEDGMRAIAAIRDVTVQRKAQQQRDEALEIISGSINYASKIQRSILPEDSILSNAVSEFFVLWKPRDVVGGDIYWARKWGDGIVLILADCTGHGVPGAFMTLIANGALDISLKEVPEGDPGSLINRMHQHIQQVLSQYACGIDDAHCSDDGLELGVCYIPSTRNNFVFAGAGFPLFICNKSVVEKLKGDRKGIGYRGTPADYIWNNNTIEIFDNSRFYMCSDGIFDQIGGPSRRGFGKKRFIDLLESIQHLPFKEHGEAIFHRLEEHQGEERRRDDISAIGFGL